MKWLLAVVAIALLPAAAAAPETDMAGLGFLVGQWSSDDGKVAETGGRSAGSSTITLEAGGKAMLRRDHTDLFDAAGKPTGGFDQIMLIYSEDGAIRAEYTDGSHVIHYDTATVAPGKSVTFTSAPQKGGPTFKLSYELTAPASLAVSFAVEAPGQTAFQPIAGGTLKKSQ